ncbi:MAG: TonB-dependent receptor plug domain-containing protein [Bacteroidota bacterium]|nr:TonB-dependent receptor plug domain-containing protein [Bacteroidota bacterium]
MDHHPWRHAFDRTVHVLRAAFGLCLVVLSPWMGWSQTTVEGHVLQASSSSKLPGVLVMAWPCGLASSTDAFGAFRVSCPHGIDSLTLSCVGFDTRVVLNPSVHVDVWMDELKVVLGQASVAVNGFRESEAQTFDEPTLMQSLDRTPGLQSLDLGAGLIQPVVRGLFGSRVAVLEDGVPQQGGRWGSDHGVLVAPELQVATAWVPGGGHVWMGPEAVGGGLRFESPSRRNSTGVTTNVGFVARAGNLKGGVHALHIASTATSHWHAGIAVSGFGATQVPQRTFSYLGRVYQLETGKLTNTAGRSGHAVLGFERTTNAGRDVSLTARLSDVHQGLFPGIVGLPRQGDLAPNDDRFDIRLPNQHASRAQTTLRWSEAGDASAGWEYKLSASWNQRREFAPPHAHGWGPLPDSDLSLALEEWTTFGEARHRGPHGAFGMQIEGQHVTTSGWEFLLPSHRRVRLSSMVESTLSGGTLAGRLDLVYANQGGHSEPLFNASGETVGVDVRAVAFETLRPGGMLSWQVPLRLKNDRTSGTLTLVAYGRVPSNHEWGANGIHHGTFRFEQGNPDLQTEWAAEGRALLKDDSRSLGWRWNAQGFATIHKGFISLTPSARFAPISHAGQIYEFQANDAFRTGLEVRAGFHSQRQEVSLAGSVLGQWDIQTGLGLPFTTPAQALLTWKGQTRKGLSLNMGCRALAPATLTARNEDTTPGTMLANITLSQTIAHGQWSLEVQNAFNRAWLDHISAYRALGLVAQGRWVQLRFTTTLKHS